MSEEEQKQIADSCGLVYSGKNFDGELEFIGTDKQWREFEKAKQDKEDVEDEENFKGRI